MKDDSTKTKVVRLVTLVLLVAVVVGGLAVAWPTYCRNSKFKAEIADLDRQIAERKAEIADLKDKQRRFKGDPEFVEGIARQDRRIYPGELVFVFDDKGKKKPQSARPAKK